MDNEYLSSDFSYKKYSLEQLDNWVNDALNCEDLTPQDIYDTIVKCIDESVEYHKKYLTKSTELLSLLKGNRSINFNTNQKDWNDFWDENYYPEEVKDDGMRPWGHSDMEALCNTEEKPDTKSKYYYDCNRNDINRKNTLTISDYVQY